MATTVVKRSNHVPPPGSPGAGLLRDAFIARMLDICGDVRFFWVADGTDTTTSTDKSRHAHTITWSESLASFDTPPAQLGSGWSVKFNGTDEEGDVPDNDLFSFGDGQNDQPFFVVSLANFTDATQSSILTKYDNGGTDREWEFATDASDDLYLSCWDESAGTLLKRERTTNLTESTWTLCSGSYDGSRNGYGISVFVNDARVDDGDASTATYTSMENQGETLAIAHHHSSGSDAKFMDGSIAFILLGAGRFTLEKQVAITAAANSFYDLSL
jgi:hypothetical protein